MSLPRPRGRRGSYAVEHGRVSIRSPPAGTSAQGEQRGIEPAEADLRATLVLTKMAGALIIRHVLELEPLVSLSADELTARLTPAVQGHLDGVAEGTDAPLAQPGHHR